MRNRPGWQETEDEIDWDIHWADVGWVRDMYDQVQLDDVQRLSHFKNHYELTRKDLMVKNLKRMRRQLQRSGNAEEAAAYNFWTETFILPNEYSMFIEEFRRWPDSMWIMKPTNRAQGRGIFLFNKLSQISDWKKDHNWRPDQPQAESYIAQRYIMNPCTVGGKKFDLRLYVLVTSFSPLAVWLYGAGFARFSGQRYTQERGSMGNVYVHLTNVAIQKKAEGYDRGVGCKLALHALKLLLTARHGAAAVDELFHDMECLVVRALLSVQAAIVQDRHCFELYGLDVVVDDALKPWLIEANASPSLSAEHATDAALKRQLVSDALDVVDMEGARDGTELEVGGFRLIWDSNGPVEQPVAGSFRTWLGSQHVAKAHSR
ncbi:tubulin-tyrosine ligase family-domain-containing protein [Tribonema minus]|uniref:Tubulin--tyrosine ligase-like protein 9 n=1 Tax=Tribonema minus TaxID=303371 RepID=A0A835ZCT8_9STRA|nr:tubulin-tyrosine ligase family-domain-containing protein [Tribonema minus]